MIAVLSLLLVATLFVTAARVATIALVGTGMATDVASFQARSALMGCAIMRPLSMVACGMLMHLACVVKGMFLDGRSNNWIPAANVAVL